MHIFHRWSKWEQETFIITTWTFGREEKVRRLGQKRTCLDCNFTRVRYLMP